MKKPELLAPAGDLSKLKTAIQYGADAVYFGGETFSLRTASDNFTYDEIAQGVDFAHERGKRCYAAVNIFPRNDQLAALPDYLRALSDRKVDAVIVSDLGVFSMVREILPDMNIHISTQANNVNYLSALKWHEMGASRVILARELSLEEIRKIRDVTPPDLQLEVFVHGAMCISYSGRCLLSNYMTGRDSNRGECAHPCRWKYSLMEEKRQGEYFDVFEDESGSFIMNSKDLCMIDHIPQVIKSGVSSLKIEGRVKSQYYVATVVNAYRRAIDQYFENPDAYVFDAALYDEVCKVSHRDYFTGFYFGDQKEKGQIYKTSSYIRDYDIIAQVDSWDKNSGRVFCSQRNRFFEGDKAELMTFDDGPRDITITDLRDEHGNLIDVAPHPEMKISFELPFEAKPGMMIRKDKK